MLTRTKQFLLYVRTLIPVVLELLARARVRDLSTRIFTNVLLFSVYSWTLKTVHWRCWRRRAVRSDLTRRRRRTARQTRRRLATTIRKRRRHSLRLRRRPPTTEAVEVAAETSVRRRYRRRHRRVRTAVHHPAGRRSSTITCSQPRSPPSPPLPGPVSNRTNRACCDRPPRWLRLRPRQLPPRPMPRQSAWTRP